jgi:hypothetical protein
MPPSPELCRQSANTAPRLRASTALPDSDPKLIAEMLITDFGRNAPGRPRAAPITLAHGKSTSWAAIGADGGTARPKVRCLITG